MICPVTLPIRVPTPGHWFFLTLDCSNGHRNDYIWRAHAEDCEDAQITLICPDCKDEYVVGWETSNGPDFEVSPN